MEMGTVPIFHVAVLTLHNNSRWSPSLNNLSTPMHKKCLSGSFRIVVASFLLAIGSTAIAQTGVSATVTIHADQTSDKIDPNIYGQFAEHLGRGIYEGVWVGEDSNIPNTRGYRNDVVAALKKLKIPVVRW